jgi:glycosyltransferase involved in cell wall biosynthesis
LKSESALPVSFVVTLYNMQHFVAECIQSILNQEGVYEFEVVVIDDASTDDSVDVVAGFSDPRIQLVRHKQNMGAARTASEGLLRARGRYIARIDPDDRYRADFLRKTASLLDSEPEVGLVYGRIATINANGLITNPNLAPKLPRGEADGDVFFALLKRNFIPAPTILARREAWAEGLPLPAHLNFGDWYLSLSIVERWRVRFIDEVLADYRIHENNMHHTMIRDRWAEPIIMEVLEKFLCSPGREAEKRHYRNEIYATQYRQLADQYFGCDLLKDARRCYWQAILRRPDLHTRPDVVRRLLGTYLGRRRYEGVKDLAKRALGR